MANSQTLQLLSSSARALFCSHAKKERARISAMSGCSGTRMRCRTDTGVRSGQANCGACASTHTHTGISGFAGFSSAQALPHRNIQKRENGVSGTENIFEFNHVHISASVTSLSTTATNVTSILVALSMRNGRALSVRRPCRGMTIQSIFFQDSHEPVDCIRARRGCQHRRLSPLRGRRHAQGPSVRLGHLGLRQVGLCAERERRRRARHLVGRHVEQLGGTGEDHVGGRKRSERAVSTGSARGVVGRSCEALAAPVLSAGAPSSDGRPPAGLPGASQ